MTADPLMTVTDVVKWFPVQSGGVRRSKDFVHAVDGVSLEMRRGETLGLVGETGCGKSTLARCMTRLFELTSGQVIFDGTDISKLSPRKMRPLRSKMQMIFQDPYGSLNPKRRVGSIIGDPFAIHGVARGADRKRRVQEVMELVGLNPEHFNRFPAEFSGGQRQRIGVARALALKPELIVCDEPVSALDVSIQAQILNLLTDLQDQLGLTYIFISHDLSVVRHVSDRVALMYLGKIVELSPSEAPLPPAPPPLRQRPAVCGARARPGAGRLAGADHSGGRRPLAGQPAERMPLPPALPEGAAPLRRRGPDPRSEGGRQPGARHRLPFPRRFARGDGCTLARLSQSRSGSSSRRW